MRRSALAYETNRRDLSSLFISFHLSFLFSLVSRRNGSSAIHFERRANATHLSTLVNYGDSDLSLRLRDVRGADSRDSTDVLQHEGVNEREKKTRWSNTTRSSRTARSRKGGYKSRAISDSRRSYFPPRAARVRPTDTSSASNVPL